jgi:hypothetical protein
VSSTTPESEPNEPTPSEHEAEGDLRAQLSVALAAQVDDYHLEFQSLGFKLVGTALDQETGTEISGALSVLRIMGRSDICHFIELDANAEPTKLHRFVIGETGQIDSRLNTFTLAKVLAITTLENSVVLDQRHFSELFRAVYKRP